MTWTVTDAGELQSERGHAMFAAPPYLYVQGPNGVFPNGTLSNWTLNGTSICTHNASVDYCLCRCDHRINLCDMSNREWHMEYLTPSYYEDQDVRPVAGEFVIYQRGRPADPPLEMQQWEKWLHVEGNVTFDPNTSTWSDPLIGEWKDPIKLVMNRTLSWVLHRDGVDKKEWFISDDESKWENVTKNRTFSDASFYRRTPSWEYPGEWDTPGPGTVTKPTWLLLNVTAASPTAWTAGGGFGYGAPGFPKPRAPPGGYGFVHRGLQRRRRSQWWIRTDGEPSWEPVTENRNFTCETKCQLYTKSPSTMTCFDIPPGVVRVDFNSSGLEVKASRRSHITGVGTGRS